MGTRITAPKGCWENSASWAAKNAWRTASTQQTQATVVTILEEVYIRLKYLSGSFTGDGLFVGSFLSLVSSISRVSPAPSLIPPLWIQLPGLQSSWHSQCVPQKGRTLKKIRKAACHHPAAPPGLPRARLLLSSRRMEQGASGAAATWDNVGGLVPSSGLHPVSLQSPPPHKLVCS